MTTISLAIIYWILGIAASFSVGVAFGAFIGAIRSIAIITKSRTAWLAVLIFSITALTAINFVFATLPIAGNLGDRTGYKMQMMLLVGAVFPGLFTWVMPITLIATASKKIALSHSFLPYLSVLSIFIIYTCGMLGALMIFAYLSAQLSPLMTLLSLILYPLTFLIAPFVMFFRDGIWLPLVLHFGGIFLGGAGVIFGSASMFAYKKQ